MLNKLFDFGIRSEGLLSLPVVRILSPCKSYLDSIWILDHEALPKLSLLFLQLNKDASKEGVKQIWFSVLIEGVLFAI